MKVKALVRPVKDLVYKFAGGSTRVLKMTDAPREAAIETRVGGHGIEIVELCIAFSEGDSPTWYYASMADLQKVWIVLDLTPARSGSNKGVFS